MLKVIYIIVPSYSSNKWLNDKMMQMTKAFIGILSSPLVVANGFTMKKYVPYNEAWDMSHSVYKSETKYSISPSIKECIEWILS